MDKPHRVGLTGLSPEVLASVFENVSRKDLKSLCEVSKHLYQVATPYLYKNVVIRCEEGLNPRSRDCEAFSRRPGELECSFGLAHVKELAITPKSRDVSGGDCYHLQPLNPPTDTGSEGSDFISDGEGDFDEESLLRLCKQLRDDTLVAFSWELATCVPENILGLQGYLPKHQRMLESLSLVTSFSCEKCLNGFNRFDLSTFRNLRTLSWIGLRSGDDLDALMECFDNNATHLRNLTLDFINWEQTDYGMFGWRDTDDEIPVLGRATSRLRFPALERLSLAEVPFVTGATMFASTFNFTQLRELRLWNCPGTLELLKHLTNSHRALPLVSLELVVDMQHADEPMERAVSGFLQGFSGLRDLFLSLYVWDWRRIIDVIMDRLRPLKRLVFHGRGVDADEESEWYEELADRSLEWNDRLSLLFASAECEVIGIANPPTFMQECLGDIASRITCTMLHLRASGDELGRITSESYVSKEELYAFAEWAFGPDGIPSLEVLAYGDFAFPEMCRDANALLCRTVNGQSSSSSFQLLEDDNKALWEWTQSHMDALRACAFRAVVDVDSE